MRELETLGNPLRAQASACAQTDMVPPKRVLNSQEVGGTASPPSAMRHRVRWQLPDTLAGPKSCVQFRLHGRDLRADQGGVVLVALKFLVKPEPHIRFDQRQRTLDIREILSHQFHQFRISWQPARRGQATSLPMPT